MYPNPQDVLPLPPRPNTDHYRKRAKDLVKACRSGDEAINAWAVRWIEDLRRLQSDATPSVGREAGRRAWQLADFARDRLMPADCALAQAQLVIARAHGFASWTRLVRHIGSFSSTTSDISAFEHATDAIVRGDLPALDRLLSEHADLVRARSDREHRATLLHYVSANGVENYRQKTPPNIVDIARRLLDAGAEVDAEADVYGGGATTLGLVVTSAHPRAAGAQIALADLLLERGARMEAGVVRSCLMNGCPEAAEHMAARGVPLTLQEASGLGRLDVVARHFGTESGAPPADGAAALMMACWYDQRDVIAFLLDHGVDVGTCDPTDGDTALHIAAYHGNPALVELLLERGAPVNVTDGVHETPPLVWALHAWLVDGHEDAQRYGAVLRKLAEAGAHVKLEWLNHDRLRADGQLYAALARRAETA